MSASDEKEQSFSRRRAHKEQIRCWPDSWTVSSLRTLGASIARGRTLGLCPPWPERRIKG
jgi:hypothetical protein